MFFKKKKKILTYQEFVNMLNEKLPLSIEGLKVSSCTTLTLLMEYKNNKYMFNYDKEYEQYLENPESIDEILAAIKSSFFNEVGLIKVNAEKILPRIENKHFIKERIEGNFVMSNVVYKQLNEELFVFFVEEREGKFYPLQKSDLLDLNYSIDELFLKSGNNLAKLPDIQIHDTEGLNRISAGGIYESSFILLDLLLRREFSVSGNIIVAVPTRDTFFVTGSEDPKNLSKLNNIIEKIKTEGHPIISDKLFLLNDYNRFVIFEESSNVTNIQLSENIEEKGCDTNELLSENEFAQLIIKKLQERIEGIKIISQDRLDIVTEYRYQKFNYKYYKCYENYTKHPEVLNQIMDAYLNVTYDDHMPRTPFVETSKILPIIRNKEFVNTLSEAEQDFEKIICDSYNDELLVFYVENRENSIYFIRHSDIINFNYSVEDLRAKALENLTADWDVTITGEEGLYAVASKGQFASSLILLDIWESEYLPVNGDVVIAISNPHKIYVTGSNDQANLFTIYDYIRTLKEGWQPIISDKLFVYKRKRFEVLE